MNPDDVLPDDPQGDPDTARIKANAQKMVAGGAKPEEIDAYLAYEASRRAPAATAPTSAMPAVPPAPQGLGRTLLQGVMGTGTEEKAAAGIKAFGDALRAKIQGQPFGQTFEQAYPARRSAEEAATAANESAHPAASPVMRFGGAVGAQLSPLGKLGTFFGPATQGAVQSFGEGDDADLTDRLVQAGKGGAQAGLLSKAGELLLGGVRSLAGNSLGKAAKLREAASNTADAANYGAAENEGTLALQGGRQSPALNAAVHDPDIQPFVQTVTDSPAFKAGALGPVNGYTASTQAYRLMSRQQLALDKAIDMAPDDVSKADAILKKKNLDVLKAKLAAGIQDIAPSFPGANLAHATAAGERDALNTAADATTRIIKGAGEPRGANLESVKSPEAFMDYLRSLRPNDARAAAEGITGRLKDNMDLSLEPQLNTLFGLTKGFGVLPAAAKVARAVPYLRAADAASNNRLAQLLQLVNQAGAVQTSAGAP